MLLGIITLYFVVVSLVLLISMVNEIAMTNSFSCMRGTDLIYHLFWVHTSIAVGLYAGNNEGVFQGVVLFVVTAVFLTMLRLLILRFGKTTDLVVAAGISVYIVSLGWLLQGFSKYTIMHGSLTVLGVISIVYWYKSLNKQKIHLLGGIAIIGFYGLQFAYNLMGSY